MATDREREEERDEIEQRAASEEDAQRLERQAQETRAEPTIDTPGKPGVPFPRQMLSSEEYFRQMEREAYETRQRRAAEDEIQRLEDEANRDTKSTDDKDSTGAE